MPLVPIAIALVGVLLSLGIVLVFYVLPKNKARKILDNARALQVDKKFQEALDVLADIDPRFAPPETETVKTDIFNESNSQIDEAIKDIDRLIGEDTPEVSTLSQAEEHLTTARALALKERVPDLDRARLRLDVATQCRQVRLALRERQFKEAERLARAINREHLTKDNDGIEGEVLVTNRTYVKERRTSVLNAADRGDDREARELLRELREASIDRLSGELNALDREVRTRIDAFEERKRAGNVASELRAMAESGRHLELIKKVEELRRSNPAALQEPEVATIINQNHRFFQNLWGAAINTALGQIQSGNIEAAKSAVGRLKVAADVYLLFRVVQQGIVLELVPQAQAEMIFPLILEFMALGRNIADLLKAGRKDEALRLYERLLVPNQPQKVYVVMVPGPGGGGAPAGYQLVPESAIVPGLKQMVEQIERGPPPR